MAMTPKQELIQAIEQSPNELVQALLGLLKVLQRQPLSEAEPSGHGKTGLERMGGETKQMLGGLSEVSSRLRRKQGILVIETGSISEMDATALVAEIREERIHSFKEIF
ncbi:MAG: hypothetical protein AAFR26_04800 [Cyanobacteria bacterium J06626_4]